MLKKYNRRVDHSESEIAGSLKSSYVVHKSCTLVIEDESDYVPSDPVKSGSFRKELIHLPTVEQKETVKDLKINTKRSSDQLNRVKRLMSSYADVLTDLPGRTNLGKHDILLLDDKPVRRKPYLIPHSLRQKVQDEIDSMAAFILILRRQNQRFETPIQNADPKRRSRGYCLCLPREEDDFVSMHCACVHYVDRRRHGKWGARFLGILNSGYCLFMHVSTMRDLELK